MTRGANTICIAVTGWEPTVIKRGASPGGGGVARFARGWKAR